jgi:hypothetical protein
MSGSSRAEFIALLFRKIPEIVTNSYFTFKNKRSRNIQTEI